MSSTEPRSEGALADGDINAAVRWAVAWCRHSEPLIDPRDVAAVSAALHREFFSIAPCETACTHRLPGLDGYWTALGLANVTSRHAWRFIGGQHDPLAKHD